MDMKFKLPLVLTGCVLLLTGCASSATKDPYQGFDAQTIYAKGHTYLQKGDYSEAITAYQSLDSQYPFESDSQKGDLEIIYAYYEDGQPALALAAADRYIRLYPTSDNLDYAYYMRGVVAYDNGRGFLQRYLPYSMSQHYAENYLSAFTDFKTVITRWPNSPYAPDARRRMIYLNDTLGQYELNVAQFYYDRGAYVAAINRAQVAILHYPTTPAARDALKLMAESYQALGMNDLAANANKVYLANTNAAPTKNAPSQDSANLAPVSGS
jgi:outer membrane protein assembly factor BamD